MNQLEAENSSLITVSAADWSLGHFVRYLAQRHGVSVVIADGLETRPLVAEFNQTPIDSALELIAKRAGVSMRKLGEVYFLGELSKGDRGVLVRRVRRLAQEELTSAIAAVLSDTGTQAVFSDGLAVIADEAAVLDRINAMLDSVESAGVPGWILQVHVFGYSSKAAEELGVSVVPSGSLAAFAATSSAGIGQAGIQLRGELDATLRFARDHSGVHTVADPLLFLADGRAASFNRTRRVPFVQSLTQTDSEFDSRTQIVQFLDVGFRVDAELREIADDLATITLDLEHGTIVDQASNLPPTVSLDAFSSVVPIQAGGVYLVGAYEAKETNSGAGVAWKKTTSEARVYQVWIRAYRVSGPVEPVGGPVRTGGPAAEREPGESSAAR